MFKRIGLVSLLVAALMVTGILVAGCGQQTPEVKSIQVAPGNVVIKGIVYTRYYFLEGSSDRYSYHRGEPVAGATVTLSGSYEIKTTTTNSIGEYVLEKVPYSSYTMVITKEGYQTTEYNLDGIGIYQVEPQAQVGEGSIITRDIDINTHPVIRNITPVPASTIETTSSFTLVFSEPMDISTVRPRIASGGVRTSAAGDNPSVTSSWSNNDTVLTIIPNGELLLNQNYQLYLAGAFEEVKDKAGHILAVGTEWGGRVPVFENGAYINIEEDSSGNLNFISFKTLSGGVPGAPTGLQLILNSKVVGVTPLTYFDADEGSEPVLLNWITPAAGEVSGYKIYVSAGSNGPWSLLLDASLPEHPIIGDVTSNTFVAQVDDVNFSIYRASIQTSWPYPGGADPVCMGKALFINDKAHFKVVAYNGEGESSAISAEAQDAASPILSTSSYNGVALTLINGYVLPATTDDTERYIAFQEPVNLTDAGTAGNYSLDGGLSVSSVTVMTSDKADVEPITNDFGGNGAYTVIYIKADGNLTGRTLTVDNVNDLAGNLSTGLTIVL